MKNKEVYAPCISEGSRAMSKPAHREAESKDKSEESESISIEEVSNEHKASAFTGPIRTLRF